MAKIKTVLFLGGLTGLILLIGYYFGGQQGILIALALSVIMNIGSYWFSDKIVLGLYRAKEVSSADNPKLHLIVQDLAQRAGIPKPKIYLVAMDAPNAFATGRDENHAAVAVTTGILHLLNDEELRGVIGHELSHIKNKDILISSIAATLAGAISYLAQMAYWGGAFIGGRGNDERNANPFGLLALIILTPLVATLLHLAVSRSREYLADESGAKVSSSPSALASALKKLHGFSAAYPLSGEPKYEAMAHMFIVNPFKASLLTSLFSTHPPVEERIKRLENFKINHV
jgi:heat shock protein HtpX